MNPLLLIATITVIHLLAAMSPGPDFVMAVKNSLQYSRRIGVYTAIGFGLGISVHIAYCLAGIAVIISNSILIFNAIKLLGAAYLVYIGIKAIISKSYKVKIGHLEKKTKISKWQAIRTGFLTNVLNPKATLFFLGLFTMVITPETPWPILLTASLIMVTNTILWFALVAVFFTHKRIRNVFERFESLFNKIFGGLLVLLGLKIALARE